MAARAVSTLGPGDQPGSFMLDSGGKPQAAAVDDPKGARKDVYPAPGTVWGNGGWASQGSPILPGIALELHGVA